MIRVLIVEDDFRVAEIHRAYVQRLEGFTVVAEAHTAIEALRLAEESRPDLVLLDIYLPDRSGLDVLRSLRTPGRHPVDVIAITADKDVETLREALKSGVVHYLVKPFQFSAFREKLESYVAMRARLAQVQELNQDEVDRIYGLLRSESSSSLPKGLSPTTLALVVRAVRAATEDVSAVDIARTTGISRVTSRRYLDHLARSGAVAISMRYGSSGRPEHRYRWTVQPREVAPSS